MFIEDKADGFVEFEDKDGNMFQTENDEAKAVKKVAAKKAAVHIERIDEIVDTKKATDDEQAAFSPVPVVHVVATDAAMMVDATKKVAAKIRSTDNNDIYEDVAATAAVYTTKLDGEHATTEIMKVDEVSAPDAVIATWVTMADHSKKVNIEAAAKAAEKSATKPATKPAFSKANHNILLEIGADDPPTPVRSPSQLNEPLTQIPAPPVKPARKAPSESPSALRDPKTARSRSSSSRERSPNRKRSRSPSEYTETYDRHRYEHHSYSGSSRKYDKRDSRDISPYTLRKKTRRLRGSR